MIIENNGNITITDIEILVKGNTDIIDRLDDLNLEPGKAIPRVTSYNPENGQIKEVQITPIVTRGEEKVMCDAQKISYFDLKLCE